MKIILLLIISALLFSSSCKLKPRMRSLPPNIFYLQVLKNNVPLTDSLILLTKLYYFNRDGQFVDRLSPTSDDTTFVSLPSRTTSGLDSVGVISSGYAAGIVADGYHNLYLQFPDGDVDTLYLEVKRISLDEGAKNRCSCDDPFTRVMVNGKDAPESATLQSGDGKPVFVFEK